MYLKAVNAAAHVADADIEAATAMATLVQRLQKRCVVGFSVARFTVQVSRVIKTLMHAQGTTTTSQHASDVYVSTMRPLQVAFVDDLPFHHFAGEAVNERSKSKERVKRLTKEIGSLKVCLPLGTPAWNHNALGAGRPASQREQQRVCAGERNQHYVVAGVDHRSKRHAIRQRLLLL